MRSFRLIVLCTTLAAGVAVPSATAARSGCPMVVDQTGDVVITLPSSPPHFFAPIVERDDPALDLRSIDITSDARSLTAVVRVVRLAALPATAPLGGRWETSLRLSGTPQFLYLWAETAPNGPVRYLAGYLDTTLGVRRELGAVTGSFDLTTSEVRITAPLDLFESVAPLTKGTWLEAIAGITTRNTVGNRSDSTRSGTHRIGHRSCVR